MIHSRKETSVSAVGDYNSVMVSAETTAWLLWKALSEVYKHNKKVLMEHGKVQRGYITAGVNYTEQ